MYVEVALVVASVNIETPGDSHFLLSSGCCALELPKKQVPKDATTKQTAAVLLEAITQLNAKTEKGGWVELEQCETMESPGILCVPYACLLPKDVANLPPENQTYKWVKASELHLTNRDLLKQILECTKRL